MKNLLSESELNDIKKLCIKFELNNYKINSDGTVDVHGDVDLSNKNLEWLPINFNIIDGSFNVSYNKLYDFHNFPKEVKGDLSVYDNFFKTLNGFDTKVSESILFSKNQLTSIEGLPNEIHGSLDLSDNNIIFLKGIPGVIHGYLDLASNYLYNLKDFPSIIEGSIVISYNRLESLQGLPKEHANNLYFNGNPIKTLEHLPKLTNTDGLQLHNLDKLKSTYCGDVDLPHISTSYSQVQNDFPVILRKNMMHFQIICKYQRHYEIWNPDASLNEENFKELLLDIEEGLK